MGFNNSAVEERGDSSLFSYVQQHLDKDFSPVRVLKEESEDAGKINRIFERFGLATVDLGSVQTEIEQDRADRAQADAIEPPERAMTHKEKVEAFLDEILKPNPTKEEQQTENPTEGRIARSRQSGPSSEKKSPTARDASEVTERRPSVKKQLDST